MAVNTVYNWHHYNEHCNDRQHHLEQWFLHWGNRTCEVLQDIAFGPQNVTNLNLVYVSFLFLMILTLLPFDGF